MEYEHGQHQVPSGQPKLPDLDQEWAVYADGETAEMWREQVLTETRNQRISEYTELHPDFSLDDIAAQLYLAMDSADISGAGDVEAVRKLLDAELDIIIRLLDHSQVGDIDPMTAAERKYDRAGSLIAHYDEAARPLLGFIDFVHPDEDSDVSSLGRDEIIDLNLEYLYKHPDREVYYERVAKDISEMLEADIVNIVENITSGTDLRPGLIAVIVARGIDHGICDFEYRSAGDISPDGLMRRQNITESTTEGYFDVLGLDETQRQALGGLIDYAADVMQRAIISQTRQGYDDEPAVSPEADDEDTDRNMESRDRLLREYTQQHPDFDLVDYRARLELQALTGDTDIESITRTLDDELDNIIYIIGELRSAGLDDDGIMRAKYQVAAEIVARYGDVARPLIEMLDMVDPGVLSELSNQEILDQNRATNNIDAVRELRYERAISARDAEPITREIELNLADIDGRDKEQTVAEILRVGIELAISAREVELDDDFSQGWARREAAHRRGIELVDLISRRHGFDTRRQEDLIKLIEYVSVEAGSLISSVE